MTNLFLTEDEIRRLIDAGELETFGGAGVVWMIRRQEGFRRLYYAVESVDKLAAVSLPPGEFITDVIGTEGDIEPICDALAGFILYRRFQRMARQPDRRSGADLEVRPTRFARPDEAGLIHQLIWNNFDPRAEHLPSLEEVAQGTILIAESEGSIAALLFYSGAKITTTLRYWLVMPEFRGHGFGRAVLERYFAECSTCRRFLLWVECGNSRAIAQYERAGYRADGLLDQILRRPE